MERREKILLGFLVCAAVGAVFYYGYTFFWGNYVEWGETIQENVQKIQEAQRQASQIEQLVNEFRNTSRELKKARRMLPEQGEFYELLAKLEQQAQDAGIPDKKIITFSRSQTKSRGLVRVMSIQAQFKSLSLEQMVSMLWRFENMRRLIDLQSFQLNPKQTQTQYFFDLNMTMNVYMLKEARSNSSAEEA